MHRKSIGTNQKIGISSAKSNGWNYADRHGGKRKGKDDIYVELITAKEELERFTAEAIKQKLEFRRQIANIEDIDARSLLQMVYIDQLGIWQICDKLGISRATYYVKLRQAEKYLD
ncbi:MAG: DUF1492 domain-containing protein [Streptococcus thermophilus]